MKHIYFLFALLIFSFKGQTQDLQPNHELRAVWLTTVWALDWPKTSGVQAQKDELIKLFDEIKAANFNAIFLQVRSESDALYASSKEPWSRWLTGTQGQDPGYDPLAFAIQEAHKRGLELHAWVNPFRVNASTASTTVFSADHISNTRPEWMLEYSNGAKIIDPGIPEGREYIAAVVGDIVRDYAVDGVHFDDYFYSYSGTTDEDAATYNQYGAGFSSVGDWRRHNINETIRLVHDTIKVWKPEARFGVSPFGIWKSGVPEGIVGLSAYSQIYADALHWLQNKTVDYVTPQLYWPIGGSQDFRKLLNWWSEQAFAAGRHVYAGHTLNDITAPSARVRTDNMRSIALMEEPSVKDTKTESTNGRTMAQSIDEVPNQIAIVREKRANLALGSVMFRTQFLVSNPHGFTDNLKETTYSYPAIPPAMSWLPQNIPAAPTTLVANTDGGTGNVVLNWSRSADNTHAFKRYAVYSLSAQPATAADIPEQSLRGLQAAEQMSITAEDKPFGVSYWVVTEVGTTNQESDLSNVVLVENAQSPVITMPAQEENLITESYARFEWESLQGATSYHYQWADNIDFIVPLAEDDALPAGTTARLFNGLAGGSAYYFRVRAQNNTGWSEWSATYKVNVDGSVTAITEADFAHSFNIYPNPAGGNDKMLVDLALKQHAEVNAQLVALDGTKLLQVASGRYEAGEHTITIDRQAIRQGVYLLIFWVGDQQKVQRVIFN